MTDVTTADTDQDERAIRDLVARAHELQNDPDGLPALHTEQVVIVNVAGRRVLGRDAFAAAMRAVLGTSLSTVRTTVEVTDVRFLSPGTALASCIKTIHDERPPGSTGTLPQQGVLTYLLTREGPDGQWRIALAQTTPVASGAR